MVKPDQASPDDSALVAAATAGDESAFTSLTRRYRRELHVHCYRMLGSFEDAEDLVQETFLRAWQSRATFQGRASFRSWLYRIATNACLDFLEKHRRQISENELQRTAEGLQLPPHLPWLQPYPDRLLDQAGPRDEEPDARVIAKETIELAFLVTLHFLPPKQRAALILCDILDWSANETASLLDTSVPSVNGALRRARATMREQRPSRINPPASNSGSSQPDRAVVEQYVAAAERFDSEALAQLLREDVRFSMPPAPEVWAGRDAVVKSWIDSGFGTPPLDDFKFLVTSANRMPAVAAYLREPGQQEYQPLALDMLRIEDGRVAEVTTFGLAGLLETFALPATLAGNTRR
jgi:RNA polymerase sigma-70 factor (ECF subfamily)